MQMLIDSVLAGVCGMAVGVAFTLLKLPAPAPNAFPPIVGVFGVYLGTVIINHFM